MSIRTLAAGAALLIGLIAGPAVMAADHGHGDDELAVTQLQLDQGRKWATDAPLRKGMQGIRDDLAERLPRIHQGALPESIGRHIEYTVVNCKLPPDADAQLHLVLEDMIQGNNAMDAGEGAQGAQRIVAALEAYGSHFDHPDWTGLDH